MAVLFVKIRRIRAYYNYATSIVTLLCAITTSRPIVRYSCTQKIHRTNVYTRFEVAFSRGVQQVTGLEMHACHKCAGVRAVQQVSTVARAHASVARSADMYELAEMQQHTCERRLASELLGDRSLHPFSH